MKTDRKADKAEIECFLNSKFILSLIRESKCILQNWDSLIEWIFSYKHWLLHSHIGHNWELWQNQIYDKAQSLLGYFSRFQV